MRLAPLVGLAGILVGVLAVEFNDQVLTISLEDVSGHFGLGHDSATWLATIYVVGEIVGMATGPTLATIFTLRRFALFAIATATLPTLLMPFAPGPGTLLALRLIQGLSGGFMIPLLMMTALRVLDPKIRLYGLAAYALSATAAPSFATALAALWTDILFDWRFIFFGIVPFATIASVLVWFGLDQDELRLSKLQTFDWIGTLLVLIGLGGLAIILEQGDRLDWFNSTAISVLALVSVVAIPALVVWEMRAPAPLFDLRLLARRNFAYAIIALLLFLVIALGASAVPTAYLGQVHAYRSLQSSSLPLVVGVSQIFLLPATAFLLDHERVDSRWVSAIGYVCILAALIGTAGMDSSWTRQQFLVWEALGSIGFAFVILPLLMMATNVVKPQEGPFAASEVNTPRAIAEALGVWITQLVQRWRGGLHRDRILDTLGLERYSTVQAQPLGDVVPALTPQGVPSTSGSVGALGELVQREVTTLTTIDTFLVLAALVIVLLVVLMLLPQRTYPPRIQLAHP